VAVVVLLVRAAVLAAARTVRVRTREWRSALRADPRLRPLGRVPGSALRGRRSNVRASCSR
jgi:hypothetical protein